MIKRCYLFLATALMASVVVIAAENNRYNMHIANDTNQDMTVIHPIAAYTDAKINVELTQIDPQEKLRIAIMEDSPEKIALAVKAGANINSKINQHSVLIFAILLRKSSAVETILRHNPNGASADNNSLREYAMQVGDARSVLYLLKKALPHDATHGFRRAVKHFFEQRDIKSVIYLLKNSSGFLLKDVLIFNDRDKAKNLISMEDILELIRSGLPYPYPQKKEVAIADILQLMQELINHGYHVDNIWRPIAGYEWIYKKTEILELFLNNGANPNYWIDKARNAQHAARKIGAPDEGTYPIFEAVEFGEIEAVRILISKGAFINHITKCHRCHGCCHSEVTPLKRALNHKQADIVALLVLQGATL